MYAKAHAGNLPGFTGVDDPYEPPENPEVTCYTDRETVEQCVDKIMGKPVLGKPVKVPAVSSRQEVQAIQVRQGDQKPPMPQRQVKCRPYFIHGRNHHHHHQPQWTVPQLCAVYDWPKKRPGGGTIAIVELGGGWTVSDMEAYFNSIGQPMPQIQDISVDGTQNSQQSPQNGADFEVCLDVQVAAASYYIATGKPAQIRVYWATDIAPAVAAAARDGCTVCSISWGLDEQSFTAAGCQSMEAAAIAATASGMTIFAAAGDNDSSDGGPGPANVDCPGSCPHVISCGGTSKTRQQETVWDNNPGVTNGEGTGGGFSTVFGSQNWQIGAPQAPVHIHGDKHPGMGRMVPDVTACADPNTGYEIIVYGQKVIIGGTSAVAPLYAGLFASFGKKLGFITPELYLNPSAFTDITIGSNGIFSAAVGVDPVSGLGAPIGTRLAALL